MNASPQNELRRENFSEEGLLMVVPQRIVILLSGIPATSKSTFARYLVRERGFAHYDLECDPRGWPHPELKETWDKDRSNFVTQVRRHHARVALDWGFPVSCLSWVSELRTQDVQLIWFDGEITRARDAYERRGGIGSVFDEQVKAIKLAGYPSSLNCLVVPALSANGDFLDPRQIESTVFR
jgi:hypothetical protein